MTSSQVKGMVHSNNYVALTCPTTLVFETCLKLGKLKCTSNFNRNYVLLLTIDNFETNQIVFYLRAGYIMHLETTCHVSHVTCQV